jgi:hypothetical protein
MTEEDKAKIRGWLKQRGTPLKFYQASRHTRKFSIEREEIS